MEDISAAPGGAAVIEGASEATERRLVSMEGRGGSRDPARAVSGACGVWGGRSCILGSSIERSDAKNTKCEIY